MKSYKLVIVESPKKAKSIGNYLGDDYKVTSSKGHIIDLPKKEIGIDVDNNFKIKQKVIPGKEEVVKNIKKLAENATEVFIAADPDREGEAIAYHLQSIIKDKSKIKRAIFHEITKDAVKKALDNPQEINLEMYQSQKTRRILDRLVGYKISPILWNKLTPGLSAGRVQSVALRIIVEREESIKNFNPEKWFSIEAYLNKENKSFTSKYFGLSKEKKELINENEDAQKILKEIKDKDFNLDFIETKEINQKPSPPFTTSKLQQEAISKLNFTAKQAMQVAQKLYEGINIKDKGTHGLITYMRTDSIRTADSALSSVREYIQNNFEEKYLAKEPIKYGQSKKAGNKIQDAHEAIRPTNMEFSPEEIKDDLSQDEFKLYSLIWNKFVSSQMTDAVVTKTTIFFKVDKYYFKTTGSTPVFDGYKKIYEDTKKSKRKKKGDDEEDSKNELPLLEKNDIIAQEKEAQSKENWTSPPSRYTEQALISTLEKKGIGRPSTYVAILSNITSRGYVDIKEKKYHPTKIGNLLCNILIKAFPEQMDIKFTAKVENQLDLIEDGSEKWTDVLSSFWENLNKKLQETKDSIKNIKPTSIPLGIDCPSCKKDYLAFSWKGKKKIVQCPSCNYTETAQIKAPGKIELQGKEKIENPCPKCNSELIRRDGKYGPFMSCSNFPNCRHIEPVSTKVPCYICKKGTFVIKQSKNKNIFYSCSEYPECKTSVWGYPLEKKCVHCLNPVLEEKEYKKEKYLICPKCNKKN